MTIYERPGLRGLEIWQSIARGVPLSQFRGREAEYFQELRRFLVCLFEGRANAPGDRESSLPQAAGFERVVICGGGALHPSLGEILYTEALPFAVTVDSSGPHAARRGACRIFEGMGWKRGVALDLGQTQLKVMTADSTAMLPRDRLQLPFGSHAIDSALGRSRLRELLAKGLALASGPHAPSGGSPDGVVLALPVALSREGVAEPATYPGLFGPVQALFSGMFACPCVVLNDAVLAAVGFAPEAGEKTLVVTLGFGIGAALWDKKSSLPES